MPDGYVGLCLIMLNYVWIAYLEECHAQNVRYEDLRKKSRQKIQIFFSYVFNDNHAVILCLIMFDYV